VREVKDQLLIIIESVGVSWIEDLGAIFVNQQYSVADKGCLDSARRYMSSHHFSEYWSLRSKIDWR